MDVDCNDSAAADNHNNMLLQDVEMLRRLDHQLCNPDPKPERQSQAIQKQREELRGLHEMREIFGRVDPKCLKTHV